MSENKNLVTLKVFLAFFIWYFFGIFSILSMITGYFAYHYRKKLIMLKFMFCLVSMLFGLYTALFNLILITIYEAIKHKEQVILAYSFGKQYLNNNRELYHIDSLEDKFNTLLNKMNIIGEKYNLDNYMKKIYSICGVFDNVGLFFLNKVNNISFIKNTVDKFKKSFEKVSMFDDEDKLFNMFSNITRDINRDTSIRDNSTSKDENSDKVANENVEQNLGELFKMMGELNSLTRMFDASMVDFSSLKNQNTEMQDLNSNFGNNFSQMTSLGILNNNLTNNSTNDFSKMTSLEDLKDEGKKYK